MSSIQRYGVSVLRHCTQARMLSSGVLLNRTTELPAFGWNPVSSGTSAVASTEGVYSSWKIFCLKRVEAAQSLVSLQPSLSRSFCSEGKRFKIYTKSGDKGRTSLYDGQRRRKDDPTFEALGDVDELNSALGLAHEYCLQEEILDTAKQIEEIQSTLLEVGSAIAIPLTSLSSAKLSRVKFNADVVSVTEQWIDQMDEVLPPLTGFILPSGGLPASALHIARSVCRRAERRVVYLVANELVEESVGQYLNRLSDYLFTAARYTAFKLGKQETLWSKRMC
ncbi:hypothetical protein R1flu_020304 [Riccia fluitans]|uniref:Corrinoid adenosyltransferase MMAB n=1 Tax=Riccia fluitans TaxID=41844 RepID=A0ABD1ZNA6_9MARC